MIDVVLKASKSSLRELAILPRFPSKYHADWDTSDNGGEIFTLKLLKALKINRLSLSSHHFIIPREPGIKDRPWQFYKTLPRSLEVLITNEPKRLLFVRQMFDALEEAQKKLFPNLRTWQVQHGQDFDFGGWGDDYCWDQVEAWLGKRGETSLLVEWLWSPRNVVGTLS